MKRYLIALFGAASFVAVFFATLFGNSALLPSGGITGIAEAQTTAAAASASTTSASSTVRSSPRLTPMTPRSQLNQEIATYQQEIQQAGADKATLQAAINSLDLQKSKIQAQVALTEKQISTTQLQITQLGGQINNTQATIATDQASLAEYLRNLEKDDSQPLFMQVLATDDLSAAWSDVNATLQVQESVANEMQALQQQESALASSKAASQNQQATLTTQQQSLTAQQQSLAQTVQSKSQLLTETNQKESTYEQLLAAAEAQLNSFSAFTQNAGGSKLLGNQTECDSWGCYYSQRDTAWGNDSLDGTKYTLASDGCLVTSMAMVLTHYGYTNVTPVTINSNPANFAAYYPAYLLFTIDVDGVSATRKTATIDATLATGNPVIVGLNAYGGTHYVVLVSGRNGNYIMKDPYVANGNDIPFTSQYSMKAIFSIAKVTIS